MSEELVTVRKSDLEDLARRLEALEESIRRGGRPPSSERRSP